MLSDILLVLIICKHQAHHYLHRYRISVFLLVALTIIAEGVVVGGRLLRQARSALQTGLQLDALRHSGKYISECPGTPSSIPRNWMAGPIAHIGGAHPGSRPHIEGAHRAA